MCNTAQRAIEVIGPAVIRADQRLITSAPFVADNPRATVAAQIMKGADFLIVAADNQRPLIRNIKGDVLARLGLFFGRVVRP